jgi:polyribonucleotide 5'-hydroxyl-kinase
MNSVLAIVHIIPGDRVIKEKAVKSPKAETKPEVKAEESEVKPPVEGESEVKAEADDGGVKEEDTTEGAEAEEEKDEDEDEDEVPYIEDIGTREVAGFIVMSVPIDFGSCAELINGSTGIDTQRRKYTILSPTPGRLPSTVALAGSIEWVDSE